MFTIRDDQRDLASMVADLTADTTTNENVRLIVGRELYGRSA